MQSIQRRFARGYWDIALRDADRWIADVRSRKLCIATGSGTVHGAPYAVKTWNLDEFDAGV